MNNKELGTFFLLAVLVSWAVWAPLWLPFFGASTRPFLPYQHHWGGLGPLVAAWLTTAIFRGPAAAWALALRWLSWRPLAWTVGAALLPFALAGVGGLVALLADGRFPVFQHLGASAEFPELGIAGFLFFNIFFFGLGEEAGWRGFALPRLQQRWNALTATLLLSAVWALWHLPLFAYRLGYAAMDAGGVAGWLFSLVTGAVIFTWLFNSSRGSVLACALFHGLMDVVFLADSDSPQLMQYLGMVVTVLGVLVLVIFGWKNLALRPRVTDVTKFYSKQN